MKNRKDGMNVKLGAGLGLLGLTALVAVLVTSDGKGNGTGPKLGSGDDDVTELCDIVVTYGEGANGVEASATSAICPIEDVLPDGCTVNKDNEETMYCAEGSVLPSYVVTDSEETDDDDDDTDDDDTDELPVDHLDNILGDPVPDVSVAGGSTISIEPDV